MDALTVHVHRDLSKRVQPSLTRPPVEFGSPVLAQLFEVTPAGPVGPATARELIEPPGTSQPFTQVIELVMRNVYLERRNTACHVSLLLVPRVTPERWRRSARRRESRRSAPPPAGTRVARWSGAGS